MVGLTFTPPLLPTIQAAASPAAGQPAVLEVLSARLATGIQNSLTETLLAAVGPGIVVTGKVSNSAPDGNVTLTLANGTEVTLHHPPELILNVGSLVTLRVATMPPRHRRPSSRWTAGP